MRAEIGVFWLLITLFSATSSWCDDIVPSETEVVAEDTDMPSMELLEFLGSWETDDGEWVDPAQFEDSTLADQESSDE
jgi:hypothetical protein